MPDGRAVHVAHGARHVLRYFGRADYTMAPGIERFAEGFLEGIAPGGLVFDVREAKMLDSTNLGLMARLASRATGDNQRCTIVSTNDDITDVLHSMGFDGIFVITSDDPVVHEAGPEEEIPLEPPSRNEIFRTMLDAHRVLVEIDEKDRAELEAVVEGLELELGAPHS